MPSFEDIIKSEQAERLKNIALSFKESDEVSVEFNDYQIGRYQVDALEKIK